jgi:hypothetical protein
MPLQVRRGPTEDRLAITPASGELIYDTTEKLLYVGDGVTPGGTAGADFTFENAQDAAAQLFTSGSHSGISFTYDNVGNRVNATVDLTNYTGNISADQIKGSLYTNSDILLVDGVLGSFQLDGTIRSNIVPFSNEIYDLGNSTNRFRDLYLSGSTIYLGNAEITSSGSAVNLPAGSTINGTPIGSGSGLGDGVVEGGNYRINVISDGSSIIVNSTNETVTAAGGFFGDLTGSVFNDEKTISLVNSTTGIINAPGGFFGPVNGSLTGSVFDNTGTISLIDAFSGTVNAPGGVFGTLFGSVNGSLIGSVFGNDGSSLIVNSFDGSVNAPGGVFGNVEGNVSGNLFGNVEGNVTGSLTGSVFGNDGSSLIVNSFDGSVNAPGGVFGNVVGSLSGNVEGNVTGSLTGSVISNDGSSLIVNSFDGSVNAPGGVFGNVEGNLRGSVISQDFSVLVDSFNNQLRGEFVGNLGSDLDTNGYSITDLNNVNIVPKNLVRIGSYGPDVNGNVVIRRTSFTNGRLNGRSGFLFEQFHENSASDGIVFHRSRGSVTARVPLQANDVVANLIFIGTASNVVASQDSGIFRVVAESEPVGNLIPVRFEFLNPSSPTDTNPLALVITSNNVVKLDKLEGLNTSLNVTGDLRGSVFADDSTIVVNGLDGSVNASSVKSTGFVQFGSLTTAERDSLTAVNGMVIYNTTNNRFEGRQNGAWINLDDGTAAGV